MLTYLCTLCISCAIWICWLWKLGDEIFRFIVFCFLISFSKCMIFENYNYISKCMIFHNTKTHNLRKNEDLIHEISVLKFEFIFVHLCVKGGNLFKLSVRWISSPEDHICDRTSVSNISLSTKSEKSLASCVSIRFPPMCGEWKDVKRSKIVKSIHIFLQHFVISLP